MTLVAEKLAKTHMAEQVKNAAVIEAGLATAFDLQVKGHAIDESFTDFYRTALALVSTGQDRAARTALAYYGEARGAAGYEKLVPEIRLNKNLEGVVGSLVFNGPVAVKKQLSTGVGVAAALQASRAKILGAGKRHVINASRDAIGEAVKADGMALGYARVSDGQPCSFCAMLVSRGPVYAIDTVDFKAHDRCGCNARPWFKGEDAWTPEARALKQLWDEHGGSDAGGKTFNGWRTAYETAVNDPSSDVFKQFTEKVASYISTPQIVAARKAASDAFDAATSAATAAQKAAELAATKAAKDAAEKAAKEAEKQAAKIKRWQGKPAPKKPLAPLEPAPLGEAAYADWLKKVEDRYTAFALKTGNPKTKLQDSNNWFHVQKIIQHDDLASLKVLKDGHYIDDALYVEAVEAFQKAKKIPEGAQAKYLVDSRNYKRRLRTYKANLADWREINGVTIEPKGMNGALVHRTNDAGLEWERKLWNPKKEPKYRAAVDAANDYTGSEYTPWNNALRTAKGDRNQLDKYFRDKSDLLDTIFKPSPDDVVVVRGTTPIEFEIGGVGTDKRASRWPPPKPEELIGSVQVQRGFTSTSVGPSPAFSGKPIWIRYRVPEGHPVSAAIHYSRYGDAERELILGRDTHYFIHNVKEEHGRIYVDAEVIPMDDDIDAWSTVTPDPLTDI